MQNINKRTHLKAFDVLTDSRGRDILIIPAKYIDDVNAYEVQTVVERFLSILLRREGCWRSMSQNVMHIRATCCVSCMHKYGT